MEKVYEKYEITPDITKLRAFRETYIATLNKPVLHKVITNKPMVYYSNGLYERKKGIFEFGVVPLKKDDNKIIKSFTEFGVENRCVKRIKYMDKIIYIAFMGPLEKTGSTYRISPSILLSEDLYNLIKIQNRDFNNVTLDDISRYSEFFTVSDKPYSVISEDRLEDMYRTGELSLNAYKEKVDSLEREEILVKTLRK